MNTPDDLHGQPCPPHIGDALALIGAGLVVLDMDLAEAAVEADLLLREENPTWVVTATIPEPYQAPAGGWLDASTAEAALRGAVEHIDAHADGATTPTERLIGAAAVDRLMRTLRHRPGSAAWAAGRDARVQASAQ